MKIGVVAVQGSVVEHVSSILRASNGDVEVVEVKAPVQLGGLHGIVLPGGESTTIGMLLKNNGLFECIKDMAADDFPVMGTCAGCVLLSSELDNPDLGKKTPLLELMDMASTRNGFGRQRESFEADVEMERIGTFPGVFIRAPSIGRVWGRCKVVGMLGETIVAAEQGSLLALSFHPELSDDIRIHKCFLGKVKEYM